MADFTDVQLKIINEMINDKVKGFTIGLIVSNIFSLLAGGTIGFYIGKAQERRL
jgi:hypothetical protein